MQKILVLITVLALSTTALAFGGGGSGRKSTAFTSGVDAVGVHFNGSACNDVACKANEIVNACSLLYVVGNTKNESGDITYESVLGTRPTGLSELKYNSGVITANITDAAVCTEVKNKLGDKVSGECSELTVTLGEVKEEKTTPETPTETRPEPTIECIEDYPACCPDGWLRVTGTCSQNTGFEEKCITMDEAAEIESAEETIYHCTCTSTNPDPDIDHPVYFHCGIE